MALLMLSLHAMVFPPSILIIGKVRHACPTQDALFCRNYILEIFMMKLFVAAGIVSNGLPFAKKFVLIGNESF